MKQLLIATAALSLIGGAAFAQNNSSINPTNNPVSATTAPPGVGIGGGVAAGSSPQAADGSSPTSQAGANMPPPSAAPAPSSSDTSAPPPSDAGSTSPSSSTPGAMASADTGSAPSTYPVCTSKHEDRCVNRSQTTRTASMHMHHMKSTTTTESSAATPSQ